MSVGTENLTEEAPTCRTETPPPLLETVAVLPLLGEADKSLPPLASEVPLLLPAGNSDKSRDVFWHMLSALSRFYSLMKSNTCRYILFPQGQTVQLFGALIRILECDVT